MLRFATMPIGDMNIADLRVAIINYIVARQKKENFLVRIDDIDKQKIIEGKDSEIVMILEKFAIKHDTLFHQSEHLNIYQSLAIGLLKENKAFICKCSILELDPDCKCENILTNQDYKELKRKEEPFVIRLKKPNQNIIAKDIIRGEIVLKANEIDNFMILDNKYKPTYNFACACDDMLSEINLIIQDEKYLKNSPKQEYIKLSLGYLKSTQYLHLSTLIKGEEITIKELLQKGFIPDAIINYILLLENPNSPKEIFTLPEAIEWFDLYSIPQNNFKFDIDKLKFINREHLKRIDDKELSKVFGFADSDIGKLAKVYLQDATTINELEGKIRAIFSPKPFDNEWGEEMKTLQKIIEEAPAFKSFEEFVEYITQKSGLKDENLFKPLQILLTGSTNSSPKLSEIYPLIKSYILEVVS